MSRYYGSIQGNRGAATRGGSTSSGIRSSVQSWEGSIITELYHINDKLCVSVSTSEYSSSYGSLLFSGTFEEFKERLRK